MMHICLTPTKTPSTASDESETLDADGRRAFTAPDGITPCSTRGDVWFDVTATEPRSESHVGPAAKTAGALAAAAEKAKRRAFALVIEAGPAG